jgi:hypothetical protein
MSETIESGFILAKNVESVPILILNVFSLRSSMQLGSLPSSDKSSVGRK